MQHDAAERRVRRGLGYVPQEHAIFAKLTVRENLLLGCVRQPDRSGIDYVLDFFPKLAQRLGQTAGTLSGGERKMLAIGRAVLGRPKLLMLDEPTEGVWVGVIEEIADRLRQLSREMAVILVEQHIELALDVAQYAYVIDRGHVALEGAAAAVKCDAELIRIWRPEGAKPCNKRRGKPWPFKFRHPSRCAKSPSDIGLSMSEARSEVVHRPDAAERRRLQRGRCDAGQPAAR